MALTEMEHISIADVSEYTPTLVAGGTGTFSTSRKCSYTKRGNVVCLSINVEINLTSVADEMFRLSLPYKSASSGHGLISYGTKTSVIQPSYRCFVVDKNATSFRIMNNGSSLTGSAIGTGNLILQGSIMYLTNE